MLRRSISQSERLALKKAWGNACAYCERPVDSFEVDHIVAYARGGSCDLENLCVTCPSCNRRKSATPLPEFYEGLLLSLAERKAPRVRKLLATASTEFRAVKVKKDRCEEYYKQASYIWRKSEAKQICDKYKITRVEYINANTNCMIKLTTTADGLVTSELTKNAQNKRFG